MGRVKLTIMETPDFEALPVGTLLKVREDALDDPAEGDDVSLRQVVDKDGYIFKFVSWLPDETFPVQAKSLATGNDTEFCTYEVEPLEKEQE